MKFWSLLLFLISFNATSQVLGQVSTPKSPEDDRAKIEEYKMSCQLIDKLIVKGAYRVDCFSNYHHFGASSNITKAYNGQLRIAGYNLLHPGTSKALFKDYLLVAKIMNQYDVVSALELLDVVGHDAANNASVVNFLNSAPRLLENLKAMKAAEKDLVKKKAYDLRIKKLAEDTQKAYSLFRAPGYLKVLTALKQLDPSWSLILSPRGDSALQGSVEELVGFFYRASKAQLALNPHCQNFKDQAAGPAVGCIINLSNKTMSKDFTQSFARRPFMASFVAARMKFTLLSNHIVFGYSGDDNEAKNLMKSVFGVETPGELSPGINMTNFARFAEIKIILDFMNRYRQKYNDKSIMYVGDTNLVANNPFWEEVLKSYPNGSMLIDQATTISPTRYSSDGKETNGVANSYDHFLLDKSAFANCSNGEVYNYFNSPIKTDIDNIYNIRDLKGSFTSRLKAFGETFEDTRILDGGDIPPEDQPLPTQLDYPLTPAGKARMDRIVGNYTNYLKGLLTVQKNEVVWDDFQYEERVDGVKRRIFLNQLTNSFYYRFYQELLSDHFPVSITCQN